MGKLSLYWHTIKHLRWCQITARIRKMLKLPITLGVSANCMQPFKSISQIPMIRELDYDPMFLSRFSVEELLRDHITFLHESESFSWNTPWRFENRSALWNFNLHYFEFLFPLLHAYESSGDRRYAEKAKLCISSWIRNNPMQQGGDGWAPYTIAVRIVNWISAWQVLKTFVEEDQTFTESFFNALYAQYAYLAEHLERDLLCNHYFEDLKALIIGALFFDDRRMLAKACTEFKHQCREQILPDGMHIERSTMYHKIILEGVIRVAAALAHAGCPDPEIEGYLQPMLDTAYSFEEGLTRIPLFHDCGNNVAKSLAAVQNACKVLFGLEPRYYTAFPDSGYYIFDQENWKLIVDAGGPAPIYNPGHTHCCAMSFELFRDGIPVLVNCGTFAYQCQERAFFRSTPAHNTVRVNGTEQSQCWGAFRAGKLSRVRTGYADSSTITMEMTDYRGNTVTRTIHFEANHLRICDYAEGKHLNAYFHFAEQDFQPIDSCFHTPSAIMKIGIGSGCCERQMYAPEYGRMESCNVVCVQGEGSIQVELTLN